MLQQELSVLLRAKDWDAVPPDDLLGGWACHARPCCSKLSHASASGARVSLPCALACLGVPVKVMLHSALALKPRPTTCARELRRVAQLLLQDVYPLDAAPAEHARVMVLWAQEPCAQRGEAVERLHRAADIMAGLLQASSAWAQTRTRGLSPARTSFFWGRGHNLTANFGFK
jgi:hypothetical protein